MAEPIRVLHFADTHIGMENYGRTDPRTGLSSRVVDFLHRMDEMIAYAREHEADLIVFAGDAFKTRTPNPTFQREFAWRVRDLAALAPTMLLVGNHDLPPTVLKASSIEIYDTLAVPNVWVASEYETRVIETRRGAVLVGAAPYPIRARLMQEIPSAGLTIAQTDALIQRKLAEILDGLAQEADSVGDLPRLLAGHFTVTGAVWGSERQIMLGRDVQIPLEALADERWDYVALGHIHKHQNLTAKRLDAPPVVYSGSIERIDFGEEGDPKGFCWVQVARGSTEWAFVPLTARPFITLPGKDPLDLTKSPNPTKKVLDMIARHNLRDAVVRLKLLVNAESEARLQENTLRDALVRAGVSHIAAIHKETEQVARARLGGSPEGLTPMQLLERYLMSKETPEERRAELLEKAHDLIGEE